MVVEAAKERCEGNDAWHLPTTIGPVATPNETADSDEAGAQSIAQILAGLRTRLDAAKSGDAPSHASLELDNQLCFALYRASHAVQRSDQDVLAPMRLTYPQSANMVTYWG